MVYANVRRLGAAAAIFALLWWGLNAPRDLPMRPQGVVQASDEMAMMSIVKSTPRQMLATRDVNEAASGVTEVVKEQLCPGRRDESVTDGVVCLVNNARRQNGLAPVRTDSRLTAAAEAKGRDLQQCGFSHEACGRDFGYWLREMRYAGGCSGENIAWKQRSAREVFTAWMNSPGHRANILAPEFRDIGVSLTPGSSGPFWTMTLGGC